MMRKISEAIRGFLWASCWTAVAILAIGPEQEGE